MDLVSWAAVGVPPGAVGVCSRSDRLGYRPWLFGGRRVPPRAVLELKAAVFAGSENIRFEDFVRPLRP